MNPMTRNTVTVVGWMPHDPTRDPTEAPPIRLMVEDFHADTREEAAEAARNALIRDEGPWIAEGGLDFAFDTDHTTPDDPNPWVWVHTP